MRITFAHPAIRILALLILAFQFGTAQQAYFVDGYHGGVYGHYPQWKTRFLVDELRKHPNWKINLEIEPETWDSVQSYDPEAYAQFKALFSDTSTRDRIEFVSPAYGQSYLYNISGESIIHQFSQGMKKIQDHFPSADFLSYSSEEPCFTSALPQLLTSFGFKYAVLKNPNTCWGGYTRAFGGETVNWIGPDGTSIPTVTRYAVEDLQPGSTWQTIAWANTSDYVKACLNDNITHPVGMCLQDAGWRGGPWLGSTWTQDVKNLYQPSEYVRWRDYFQKISTSPPAQSWKFSQEDMLVSLVWGSQVLQQLAQQVRVSENKIVVAEKLAALHALFTGNSYPNTILNSAWRTLLLSQHHDCWIVPYNGKPGNTWADKTKHWTDFTNKISDSIIAASIATSAEQSNLTKDQSIFVYNTTGKARKEVVSVKLPDSVARVQIIDDKGKRIPTQTTPNSNEILFVAEVPSLGFTNYRFAKSTTASKRTSSVSKSKDLYLVNTAMYELVINAAKGGTIQSIKAKHFNDREFVNAKHDRAFNELRGFFYAQNKFVSSADQPAKITILEDGSIRTTIKVEGRIGEHPFTQTIMLHQGDPKIDFDLQIDWVGNPGIGHYDQSASYKADDPEKAFYNDGYKLLALFPANFSSPKIFKDAPFDVTESKLDNTFFNRWDSIKNNVILHWVDLEDKTGDYGMALLTDHTTSYAFGQDHPLGLTIEYSGKGLWGRDYKITGPTKLHYAIVPHAGKWDEAGISGISNEWNEPLIPVLSSQKPENRSRSWLTIPNGWEVSSLQKDGEDMLVRLFNASKTESAGELIIDGPVKQASLVELNWKEIGEIAVTQKNGKTQMQISMPKFGIRTIRLKTE